MNKEKIEKSLLGKYINGYKIVEVSQDPFVKGQINLITDEITKYNHFTNSQSVIMFRLRNEDTFNAKWTIERTTKEHQALIDIKEYIKINSEKFIPCYGDSCDNDIEIYLDEDDIKKILDIINKALGSGNNE